MVRDVGKPAGKDHAGRYGQLRYFKYNTGDVRNELAASATTTKLNWGTRLPNGHGVTEGFADKAATISHVRLGGVDYDAANYVMDTANGKYTRIRFGNIPIVRAKQAVEFTVTLSDGSTFEVKYSISDYAIQAQNGEQSDLIVALMKYVNAVRTYLAQDEELDIDTEWVKIFEEGIETNPMPMPTMIT